MLALCCWTPPLATSPLAVLLFHLKQANMKIHLFFSLFMRSNSLPFHLFEIFLLESFYDPEISRVSASELRCCRLLFLVFHKDALVIIPCEERAGRRARRTYCPNFFPRVRELHQFTTNHKRVDQPLGSKCSRFLISSLNNWDVKPSEPSPTCAPPLTRRGSQRSRWNSFFCSHEDDILLTSRTVISDAR